MTSDRQTAVSDRLSSMDSKQKERRPTVSRPILFREAKMETNELKLSHRQLGSSDRQLGVNDRQLSTCDWIESRAEEIELDSSWFQPNIDLQANHKRTGR